MKKIQAKEIIKNDLIINKMYQAIPVKEVIFESYYAIIIVVDHFDVRHCFTETDFVILYKRNS